MATATFVLSTGRCGTQWLADTLRAIGGERMRVEHEPLHNKYQPALMLGAEDPARLREPLAKPILRHIEDIAETLQSRDYLETGHPCWSTLPYLIRRFGGRIRIVHLVRHPVPTCCSWVANGAYAPAVVPGLPIKEPLTPFSAGVAFPEYRERWPDLSPFERCLYYWTEINAFGLKLEADSRVPWLQIRYEDLLGPSPAAFIRLVRFLDLPERAAANCDRKRSIDRFRTTLPSLPQLDSLAAHPATVTVAAHLGYQAMEFDQTALIERFLPQ